MSAPETDAGRERTIEEIRRDIERRRDSITRTVDRVGQRVQETLSWREQVRDHPYMALGIAAGAGFALALLLERRSSPSERLLETLSDSVAELGDTVRESAGSAAAAPRRSGLASTLAGIAGAVVARVAVDMVRDRVVGGGRTEAVPHGPERDEGPASGEAPEPDR